MFVRQLLFILAAAATLSGPLAPAATAGSPDRIEMAELSGPAATLYAPFGIIRQVQGQDAAVTQVAPVIVTDGALLDRTVLISRIFVALGALLTVASAARMLVL